MLVGICVMLAAKAMKKASGKRSSPLQQ